MYLTKDQLERDNQIIGEKTHRYYIGNYIGPERLDEDLKVFSQFGEFDGK